MRKKIICTILFISLTITISILFLATDFYIPKRKVMRCQAVLGNAILREVNIREKGNDTIFLVKNRYYNAPCGLYTEELSFLDSFKLKFSELKLALTNPYSINIQNTYASSIFNFGNRKIIIGEVSSFTGIDDPTNFSSEIVNFEIYQNTNERKIYYIKYENIKENEITISIYDEIKKEEKYTFTFEMNGENCRLKS